MKRNLQIVVVPAAIAASFLVGCGAPRITERTDQTQPSIVLVQQGYDTLGRRWEDDSYHPAQAAQPAPAVEVVQVTQTAQPAQPAEPKMITRNDVQILNFTGTITDLDYAKREVTLQDSQGQSATFAVDKDVQRFHEAKVGDKVSVNYYTAFNAEVREPTAEEREHPLVVLQATGRAGSEEDPAGTNKQQIRAVVTIEALDRVNQTITVKGPGGKNYITRVADPSRFDQVHIGDTIVINFTESEAVSLTPAAQ